MDVKKILKELEAYSEYQQKTYSEKLKAKKKQGYKYKFAVINSAYTQTMGQKALPFEVKIVEAVDSIEAARLVLGKDAKLVSNCLYSDVTSETRTMNGYTGTGDTTILDSVHVKGSRVEVLVVQIGKVAKKK